MLRLFQRKRAAPVAPTVALLPLAEAMPPPGWLRPEFAESLLATPLSLDVAQTVCDQPTELHMMKTRCECRRW